LPRGTKGLGAFAKPRTRPIEAAASLSVESLHQFLIANLELEFNLSHRNDSSLKISDRKETRVLRPPGRVAIFHLIFSASNTAFRALSPTTGTSETPNRDTALKNHRNFKKTKANIKS
jgi:hypothetical protein